MKFIDYAKWLLGGQIGLCFRLLGDIKGSYRVSFLAEAGKNGVLAALASAPLNLEELLDALKLPLEKAPSLKAFLHLGLTVGEIAFHAGRYQLKGKRAKALADKDFDPFLAMAEEVCGLHVPYIGAALEESDGAKLLELTNRHSEIIARSSRIAEPMLKRAMEQLVSRSGAFKLLEIGSGSGAYLSYALALNPQLTAVGVERVETLAQALKDNIACLGLASRVEIFAQDIRTLDFTEPFDCITLFNNIYYFPEHEHAPLLAKLHRWLRPGGKIAIVTLCRDGVHPLDAVMHMWSAMTPGASVLVEPKAFESLMQSAGFATETVAPVIMNPAIKIFIGKKA